MQKVIRSRKNCSNRLIIPNIRNLQYFGLYCQYSASIPVYHQDLWGIYVRENSFFAGFITHSPTISTLSTTKITVVCSTKSRQFIPLWKILYELIFSMLTTANTKHWLRPFFQSFLHSTWVLGVICLEENFWWKFSYQQE